MKYKYLLLIIVSVLFFSCSGGDADRVPAYKGGSSADLAPVVLPPISENVLANGLKVIAVEHHELPVVSFRIMIQAGSAQDPIGKAGLGELTADLLLKGTKSRGAKDIAEEIDFVGGNLNASSSWDASYITCNVLKKHFDVGLDLFSDVTLNPLFQKSEIDRQRKRAVSSYIDSKDDLGSVAAEHFNRVLFGEHPFGYESNGTDITLNNITRKDILDFYKNYYAPNNAVLVISGDITPEEAFAAAEKSFTGWEKKSVEFSEIISPSSPQGYKIVVVNKSDATQSQIRVGHLGIERSNEDYFRISLMNYILGGGGFSSRLMKIIRSEKGLTYGISSRFSARKMQGPFTIGTFTKNESVGEAVKEIINQMRIFLQKEATAEELADAKSYLNGSYPMRFETPDQFARQLLNVELYDLGADYISNYRENVQNVTLEQIQEAAQQYLDPDNMVIVVVGNKDEVISQLEDLGVIEVLEIN